eukprot:1161238-Pelagomonas_calceolata.AAC.4
MREKACSGWTVQQNRPVGPLCHNTKTTGALTPETLCLVPIITSSHTAGDFQRPLLLSCYSLYGDHMISNPYSKLTTAYPHLCCELGTIARTNLCCNDPQSSLNQEIPLSQHSWDLQIFAVWNTGARFHLSNHNPDWLRGLAAAVSEAKWKLRSVGNHPTLERKEKSTQATGRVH